MYPAEKPFSCDVEGCSMKFVVEDHLTVHKKRHDMLLNLGQNHKGGICADQTPTPTRFIRNCEEVGLFQDLQNVNPFEETFRKAAEAVKTGGTPHLNFTTNPPDDTLHTPNVFPHISDSQLPLANTLQQSISVTSSENLDVHNKELTDIITSTTERLLQNNERSFQNQNENQNPSLNSDLPVVNIKSEEELHVIDVHEKNDESKIQVLLKVPGGRAVQFYAQEINQDEAKQIENQRKNAVVLNAGNNQSNVKLMLKDKLIENATIKLLEQNLDNLKIPIPKVNTFVRNYNSLTFGMNSEKIKAVTGMVKPKGRPKRKTVNYVRDTRNDIKARNRAASTRSRQKKKLYLQSIEKLNSDLKMSNKYLTSVNLSLLEEIRKLKKVLLQHFNCSTTQMDPGHSQEINKLYNSVPMVVIGNETYKITDVPNKSFFLSLVKSVNDDETIDSTILQRSMANDGIVTADVHEETKEVMVSNYNEDMDTTEEVENSNDDFCDSEILYEMQTEVLETPEIILPQEEVTQQDLELNSYITPNTTTVSSTELNAVTDASLLQEHSYSLSCNFINSERRTVISENNVNDFSYMENISTIKSESLSRSLISTAEESHIGNFVNHSVRVTEDVLISSIHPTLLKPFKKRNINDGATSKL